MIAEADVMSVPAATVVRGDQLVYLGEYHRVTHVANGTPRDGQITWTLEGVVDRMPVSAIRKVFVKRT